MSMLDPAPLRRPRLRLRATLVAALVVSAPGPASAQRAETAGPIFRDGQAQVVPAFQDSTRWIHHDLWVEAEFDSDGDGRRDRLHVDVFRPEQTRTEALRVPVVYESSPYYSGVSGNRQYLWDVRQELGAAPPARTNQPPIPHQPNSPTISRAHVSTWVPRGFAVVHSESPGTGTSQGCPTVGGTNESLAPKAVIDWLNGRARGFTTIDGTEEVVADWSTGKVGMIGTSYNGTLPLAAATTGVEGLEAIIPVAPNTSYYHYYRSHGLIRHPGGWLGEDIDFLYDFINSGWPERRPYCDASIRDGEMAAGRDRVSGDLNEFWMGRDYLRLIDRVEAATLMAHAFNDWNVMPEHSVRVYEALKERGIPAQAYFHQGGHGGEPPLERTNRWFTRYLYGVENGVEQDPRAWIVREGDARTEPTPYTDYPNPAAADVVLRPLAGGEAMGSLRLTVDEPQTTESLVDDVALSGAALAKAERSPSRLLYATAELREDVHLSGTARVRLVVASSRPAANLSVWLVTLPWTDGSAGTASIITRGWADPQNYRSLTESEPLAPGRFYQLTFDLQPDDQVIPAGKRIGLMVFSSDRDFTLWPEPGTELTLDLDGSWLEIPVVGGSAAFRSAVREGS
jgi:X-Pro dipeptidyl-peptidase